MTAHSLLMVTHVIANLVWIGSILAVGVILSRGAQHADVAVLVYKRLSVGAFVLSFVSAVVLLFMNPVLYFKSTHWMHGKLPLALAVIGIHHVLGARAKGLTTGKKTEAGPVIPLTLALFVCAGLAAGLAKLKPF